MIRLHTSLLFCVASLLVAGCRHWPGYPDRSLPPLEQLGERTDPETEFYRLQRLLAETGHSLYASGDTNVRWIDAQYFRVYEFAHHTVLIFPYDWTSDYLELVFVAGTLRDHEGLPWSLYPDPSPSDVPRTFSGVVMSDPQPDVDHVGWQGAWLWQDVMATRSIVGKRAIEYPRGESCGSIRLIPDFSTGTTASFGVSVYYQENRLMRVSCVVPYLMPGVTPYSNRASGGVPITATGEFEIRRGLE